MASALPPCYTVLVIFKLELISWHEPDIVAFIGEHEVCNSLVRQTALPAHTNISLRLRLLELPIVVGLELDERLEHFFVLLRVPVPQQNWLRARLLLLHFEVFDISSWALLPKFFKLADFLGLDLS